MHVHALCNVDNEFDVRVVMVVCTAGYFDIVVCHSDVVCVGLQIFGCGHDRELDRPFVAESLVCPLTDGSNFLDSSDTVVGDQNLVKKGVSSMRLAV